MRASRGFVVVLALVLCVCLTALPDRGTSRAAEPARRRRDPGEQDAHRLQQRQVPRHPVRHRSDGVQALLLAGQRPAGAVRDAPLAHGRRQGNQEGPRPSAPQVRLVLSRRRYPHGHGIQEAQQERRGRRFLVRGERARQHRLRSRRSAEDGPEFRLDHDGQRVAHGGRPEGPRRDANDSLLLLRSGGQSAGSRHRPARQRVRPDVRRHQGRFSWGAGANEPSRGPGQGPVDQRRGQERRGQGDEQGPQGLLGPGVGLVRLFRPGGRRGNRGGHRPLCRSGQPHRHGLARGATMACWPPIPSAGSARSFPIAWTRPTS